VTVAHSGQPRVLFEAALPPRYYLPLTHAPLDLLRPLATQSHCPYTGTASYWSLAAGAAVHQTWRGPTGPPLAESQKIAGLGCFYNEKDDLNVVGVLQDRRTRKSADSRRRYAPEPAK
jgi:uncharacterized protein (DUF427 family)